MEIVYEMPMLNTIKKRVKKYVPISCISFYHVLLAVGANIWYGFPSRRLIVIGVTGTDGKTTTSHFIMQLLQGCDISCGLLSTTQFKIGDAYIMNETKMTTLSAFQTQKRLREMVKAKNTHVVVETSSHAMAQYRVWGIAYDVAVLTNISREHLDYHKTMQSYIQTKKKLFQTLGKQYRKKNVSKSMILNADDAVFEEFRTCSCDQQYAYGFEQGDIHVKKVVYETRETMVDLSLREKDIHVRIPMPGKVNVYNMMAACGVLMALGYTAQDIQKASMALSRVQGRMQEIRVSDAQDFSVFIDYAVTPNAFESLYETLRLMPHNRIIAVFGACGDRDKGKRPILGRIAYTYADFIILTNEDNWSEQPLHIIQAIEAGIKQAGGELSTHYAIEIDREKAISQAIFMAQAGDIVVVTGKGSETGMAISKDEIIAWSDTEIISTYLKQRFS